MADRYWVGGTATWNATAGTKWSTTSGGGGGASVPTASDRALFDGNSGSGTVTVGATGSPTCLDLVCTGFTGAISGNPLSVAGSVTLGSGMTATSLVLSFTATSGTKTLTSNGKTIFSIT